jgi:hypothetical protein
MLTITPPFPRRQLDRRRMRGPGPAPNRHAANSARYRYRKRRGQGVYYLTANKERLIDLLVRKGYLADDVIHSHATIELAVCRFIDDEGQK